MQQMKESLQKAINKCNTKLFVNIYREYGEKRSAGFEIINFETDEVVFTMDIDVNRPQVATKIYEIDGIKFIGVSPIQIISDKTYVLSTNKVFRRIKDVIDLYYISHVFTFNKDEVIETLENNKRELGNFDGFLYQVDELKHSYEKFRFDGNVDKPSFDEIYNAVKAFIKDILPEEKCHEIHHIQNL